MTPRFRDAPAGRPPALRRSVLAAALAAATLGAAPSAFALGCVSQRTGGDVLLSRDPNETSANSYYGYGGRSAIVPFDATGLDRLELRGCLVDEIAHGALVTDRPIEIVIDNATSASPGPHDPLIDLSRRIVNPVPGGSARNRIVVNGGRLLSTVGPDGAVPLDVVFNGGAFGGAGSVMTFNPNGRVRDGDSLTVNAGVLTNTIRLGGGADSARFTGGDAASGFTLYGDGGSFSQATLNTFGHRFDDTFELLGGRIDTVHGDSGDQEAARDANGQYTGAGGPAGNDLFVLAGAQVRRISGDDGDDRLEIRSTSTLLEFRGGYGSDTVDIAAGVDLANLRSFEGDSGNWLDGFRGRSGDRDVIRFRGQQFAARSDGGTDCPTGVSSCPAVNIHGFERIELLDGARMSLFDRGGLEGADFGDPMQTATTTVVVGAGSALSARRSGSTLFPEARLRASVVNDGVVDLGQDAAGDVLQVAGDWSGSGRVLMSTVLGGDDSLTDRLRIEGSASGRTVLDIAQAPGSVGARTVDGILLVQVRGASTADAFVLAAPITTSNGLWQYRLERATSGAHAGSFVLTSSVPTPPPANPPPTTPPPATPPPTSPPPPGTPPPTSPPPSGSQRLLAPVVTTAAVSASMAQGLFVDGLADEETRALAVREGGSASAGTTGAPVWLQVQGDRLRTRGARFGQDVHRAGLQAGIDLQRDARTVRGLVLRVAQADGEMQDHLRPTLGGFATPLGAAVGRARVQAVTVGGYQTLGFGRGYWLDLGAEAGSLRARLSPDEGPAVRREGWAAAASGTLARVFTGGGWDWRPQVQLIAAHTRLGGLDGAVSSGRLAQDTLRGRLGVRVSRGEGRTRLHAVANLWRDLHGADRIVFRGGGDATTVEAPMARGWAELGIGLSQARGPLAWHVDLRGERAVGDGERTVLGAQAGLSLRW